MHLSCKVIKPVSLLGYCCLSYLAGALLDSSDDEEEEEHTSNEIHSQKTKECKEAISGRDSWRSARHCAEQPVDEPWLSAKLGGHPAGRIGNIREGKA